MTPTLPLVSILIPVYNREKYIEDCIRSALNQTYRNVEVVVVDNCSTDKTWELCEALAAKESRLRIYRQDVNVGPVKNWQTCGRIASGLYSKLLFSDDLIEDNYIEKTLPYLQDDSVAFVSTSAKVGEQPEKTLRVLYKNIFPTETVQSSTYLNCLALGKPELPYSPGTALFRTRDFQKNLSFNIPTDHPLKFENHGAGPDVLLFAKTAIDYKKVVFLSNELVFFRSHEDSITIQNPDNIVHRGYEHAIASFCQHNLNRKATINWLSCVWLGRMKRNRRWIAPLTTFREIDKSIGIFYAVTIIANAVKIYTIQKLQRLIN
jgi:glycosyltransferase involved in cell wall biosynthesis